MKRSVVALCAVAALAACHHGPTINAGLVAGKSYRPHYCNTTYIPIIVGKVTVIVPQVNCYDDEWSVTLKRCDGKCHATNWSVPRKTYDRLEVGDAAQAEQGWKS